MPKEDTIHPIVVNLVKEISNKEDLQVAIFWLDFELFESRGPSAIKTLKELVAKIDEGL